MNCIVAVDINWGIGINNQLLFHIPADLQYFREKTDGKIVVMGKNTLLSLPNQRPLPNKTNIVLSTSIKTKKGCIICGGLEELFCYLKKFCANDIFVIGGEETYRLLLPYCHMAFITKIYSHKTANKFFPNLDIYDNWSLVCESDRQVYNNVEFSFCEYMNENFTKMGPNALS